MDKIYADLIVNNVKLYSQVPKELQEKVKIILKKYMNDNVITKEEYEDILTK